MILGQEYVNVLVELALSTNVMTPLLVLFEVGGDFLAGAIAGATTWSIGQVALEYFEENKQLSPKRLQQLYKDFYHRFHKENNARELQEQSRTALSAGNTNILLEEPDVAMGLAPALEEKA